MENNCKISKGQNHKKKRAKRSNTRQKNVLHKDGITPMVVLKYI